MINDLVLRHRSADILNFVFLAFLAAVVSVFHQKIKNADLLLLLYSGLILMQAVAIKLRDRGRFMRVFYNIIFPTVSILLVFDSLERIVHYINPSDIDPLLIRLDYRLLGYYPTVMLERFTSPLLTDVMQVAYSSYYFIPVSLGVALYRQERTTEFERSLFLIMLCFYLSYVGYMVFPALGPRYTMAHLQSTDLEGLLIAGHIQELLNRLEGVKRDAFPSGHTGVALTVLWLSWRFEKRLFYVLAPVVAALVVSTVYCRYHYVVDVIGGVLLCVITMVIGEVFYGCSPKRVNTGS